VNRSPCAYNTNLVFVGVDHEQGNLNSEYSYSDAGALKRP